MRFRQFSYLSMSGPQHAMLIGGTPRSKNPIWRRKDRKYASRLWSFVAHIISRVLGHIMTKSNSYIHVFEIQLFNYVVDNVTGSRVIPEIDMAAAQTGSSTISAHRTDRNKIPTAIFMFLGRAVQCFCRRLKQSQSYHPFTETTHMCMRSCIGALEQAAFGLNSNYCWARRTPYRWTVLPTYMLLPAGKRTQSP